jgi:hypothetical protein
MDLDDDELWATQYAKKYIKKSTVAKDYISKDEVLKALGYEENDEEYKRLYNKEELILSLIRTINEEFDRLEDIEDQKVEVAVDFIEEKRDKYWKDKLEEIVGWNIVIKDEKSNNYRPIKNTSAQDVYEAFYKIRELVKGKI